MHTLSTSTSHDASVPNSCVHVPMRPYTAAVGAAGELARDAADGRGVDAAGGGDALRARTPRRAAARRRGRSRSRRRRRDRRGPRRTARARARTGRARRSPGRIARCSSASSAVFVRRGSTTTSLPPRARERLQPPGDVGRGHQRAVRRVRVRAEHQEVVGAVDVGDRDRERRRRTSDPPTPASASGRRCSRSRRSSCAPPAATPGCRRGRRGCARSDCRGRPRARRARTARGSASRPASIAANASSHVTSWNVSPRRTSGRRIRSGSDSSCFSAVPFGHRKPWLNTSSRSPRTSVISRPSRCSSSPHVASQRWQVRYSVRVLVAIREGYDMTIVGVSATLAS